jgi:hypothetical protein
MRSSSLLTGVASLHGSGARTESGRIEASGGDMQAVYLNIQN